MRNKATVFSRYRDLVAHLKLRDMIHDISVDAHYAHNNGFRSQTINPFGTNAERANWDIFVDHIGTGTMLFDMTKTKDREMLDCYCNLVLAHMATL